MTHRIAWLAAIAALTLPAAAKAEWRCDCTTITASCSAEVSIADAFVEVTADTNQCARVDYFIDGQPFVAVVTEGRARQDWISRSGDPNVLVQGCQVCRDNADADAPPEAPATSPAEESGANGLEPLIEVVPSYPEAADREASGFVEVRFTVLPSGEVEDVTVTESEPGELFDSAAVAAVRRWRYPADQEREPRQLTARLEFTPDMAAAAPSAPADETAPEPTDASAGAAGQCVRENTVYNYGEIIEVELINACAEPLAVYACAQGVGPRQGRWHCLGPEAERRLLVPRDDERVGQSVMADTGEGVGSFEYADEMFLTRAPNTQYWWLACRVPDTRCRAAARDWMRAVDGQLARIDPQVRTPERLSRSY